MSGDNKTYEESEMDCYFVEKDELTDIVKTELKKCKPFMDVITKCELKFDDYKSWEELMKTIVSKFGGKCSDHLCKTGIKYTDNLEIGMGNGSLYLMCDGFHISQTKYKSIIQSTINETKQLLADKSRGHSLATIKY